MALRREWTDGLAVLDPRGFYSTSGACSVSPFTTIWSTSRPPRRSGSPWVPSLGYAGIRRHVQDHAHVGVVDRHTGDGGALGVGGELDAVGRPETTVGHLHDPRLRVGRGGARLLLAAFWTLVPG